MNQESETEFLIHHNAQRLLSVQIITSMLGTLSMLIHSSESSTLMTFENLYFFLIYLWQEMLWTSVRLPIF